MISRNSVLLSVSAAQLFESKGLTVKPKPDTALMAVMNNMPVLPFSYIEAGGDYFEDLATYLETASSGTLGNPSAHDTAIEELDNKITVYIKQHMSFAKNTVVPVINELHGLMQTFKDSFVPKPASSMFNIIQCEMPAVVADVAFNEWMRPYGKDLAMDPISNLNLGERTAEEIVNLMLVQEKELDLAITTWVASKDENFIKRVWNGFFNVSLDTTIKPFTMQEINLLDEVSKAHALLAVFLIARGLFANVSDNAKNMTLATYNSVTSSWRDWAGSRLYYSMDRVREYIKKGVMVLTTNPNTKECSVLGEVYRAWLKTGGNPEILLGMLVAGKRLITTTAIDEDVENLLARWRSYTSFHDNAEFNKTILYFKNALTSNFALMMDRITEEECLLNPGYRRLVKQYFEEELANITNEDMADLDEVCLRVVCRARYYYTDSEKILRGINAAMKHNPSLSVQEAAFASMTDYVVDYICDQMYVTTDI